MSGSIVGEICHIKGEKVGVTARGPQLNPNTE